MYRKNSGSTGFSFGRLMVNAFPNFANDTPEQDAELTSNEKDILWIHQVQGAQLTGNRKPMELDEESFMKAGITSEFLPLVFPPLVTGSWGDVKRRKKGCEDLMFMIYPPPIHTTHTVSLPENLN